ncbi:hypothetical protein CAC42_7691 [Sphaceloma murrayae]|uniref:Carbohydrate-binding module family 19 domain-containing protein n=1 Tax=Sphaceloma murrayae TaxID=2082308 RepID=A0A2K1QXE9_9PEZI|nr:hypothetical protein CAC42_7691 [Sphaceloma murrayae]
MHAPTTSFALAVAALSSVTSAHIILSNPTPFAFQNPDHKLDPLLSDGSDYPCKKVNGQPLQSQGSNPIAVGQQYNLEWTNYVTHGGGSCQLSVTRDLDPTKSSVFKVIKTWQGGCPIASTGNTAPNPLPWEMPSEVQNGDAVLAWTWIPRFSQSEELYMNCAPITVSGGASDDSAFNQLPDLYVPNLPSSSCHKPLIGQNLVVPNPGKYAETSGAQFGFIEATGDGCAAGAQPEPTGGYGVGNDPAPASPAPPAPTPAPSAPQPSDEAASPSVPPTSQPTSYTPPTGDDLDIPNRGYAPAAAPAAAPAPAPAPVPAAQPAVAATVGANQSCSIDGAIVCNGDREFALCNFGKVESWSRTADGTVCRNGEIKVSDDYIGKGRLRKHRRHLHLHGKRSAGSL